MVFFYNHTKATGLLINLKIVGSGFYLELFIKVGHGK